MSEFYAIKFLPVNQNLQSVYFSLSKFQLVSCNLSLAMICQMTYIQKLPKLCSATSKNCKLRLFQTGGLTSFVSRHIKSDEGLY